MIRLNLKKFSELQGDTTETDMAKFIGISRSQLWRLKTGSPVGEDFILKFKMAFPDKHFEDYFFCNTVD